MRWAALSVAPRLAQNMRQLHITNWYPNRFNPFETPFIREYFKAIPDTGEKQLWHVQVRNEGSMFKIWKGSHSDSEHYLILDVPIFSWRIKELLHAILLLGLRVSLGRRKWDVVNVHIAYPLLRFPKFFKSLFGDKVLISEHWSAYHSGFNLAPGSRARRRIEKIFHHGIPVCTVSNALSADIVNFAGTDAFPRFVIPNIVDPDVFHPPKDSLNRQENTFLMVGNWTPIKRPLLILEAFEQLLASQPEAKLRIAGYGHQIEAMQKFVADRKLGRSVRFLGALPKERIAAEMQKTTSLLHASAYETFCVVCAEALCCGTPVVASRVGGIPEFVHPANGILVDNELAAWIEALESFSSGSGWNRKALASEAHGKFSPFAVGPKIHATLREISAAG